VTRAVRRWLVIVFATLLCQAGLAAQTEVAAPPDSQQAQVPAAAPDAIKASAGDARVVLSWQPLEGATGYRIFRAIDGIWEIDPVASIADTTYTHSGLTNGTTYTFAIAAYTTAGTGPKSAEVTATPAAPPENQASTAGTVASPEATSESAAESRVTSADSTDTAATAALPRDPAVATAARVMAPVVAPQASTAQPTRPATAAQPSTTAAAPPVSTAAASDTTVRPAPAAVAPATTSESAAPAVAAAVAPAAAPLGVTASGSEGTAALSWQPVAGATGYRIFAKVPGAVNQIALVTGTTHTISGLTNGAAYTFRVAALNNGGTGPESVEVVAVPMTSPRGLKAEAINGDVMVSWQAADGASTYIVYRGTSEDAGGFTPVTADQRALSFVDRGLTNGTQYFYRVRALTAGGASDMSAAASVTAVEPPPTVAPANLVAAPGSSRVVLTWGLVSGATSYRVFRSTTGVFDGTWIATVTAPTLTNTGLTNGTTYWYRVTARNSGGDGPFSAVVTATPIAVPSAPAAVAATGGNGLITVKWAVAPGATTYNVYRGSAAGAQSPTPLASGLSLPAFVDTSISNGPSYYYKVTAVNTSGESPRSAEANAAGEGPPLTVDPVTQSAYRLLQQSTWGPRLSDIEHVRLAGAAGFIDQQLSLPPSAFPDTLFSLPLEDAQEHFMQLALYYPDQLRQRVAWALHKIWVVSAVEVPSAPAIITYYRLLMEGAFGNYRDLMRAVTLNPAMGRYLNMLNNRSQLITGVPPNENYARELMQLFTLGIPKLNPDGTPVLDATGAPVPAYTEEDVKELARILTGWTFGDGNPATSPTRLGRENYRVPMEVVPAFHDSGAKYFLGEAFPANQTAQQDFDQAMNALFYHANVGPFISRQLIQQLVTSNPSPGYVAAVAAVFNNPAGRGDLGAVVRAILLHPEASTATPVSGKLAEPVLFVVAPLRALGANVTNQPFMSLYAESMGQKVFYPPSVFSYFSPGYRVRGTAVGNGLPLGGPEFQILTSVTALERANYIGALLGGSFSRDVTIDLIQFTSRAVDPGALVDYCNLVFLGGRMSAEERSIIVSAVRASSTTANATERVRTAIYLSLVIAQSQVDR
jgi:uncharacterized protein (DUF1800 family)/fibronectin type 3 domain-containing protein